MVVCKKWPKCQLKLSCPYLKKERPKTIRCPISEAIQNRVFPRSKDDSITRDRPRLT
jgi:hypothetical protein